MKTALLSLLALLGASSAYAQDDLDGGSSAKRQLKTEVVREIERGMYLKAGAGSMQYLGISQPGGLIRPVLALDLVVGQDFVDKEKMSLAWEARFSQSLQNGPKVDQVFAFPGTVQGDIHTFSGMAMVEASTYLTRRFGLGLRAGGGLTIIPVLMSPTAYESEVLASWGIPSAVHDTPLPTFGGGPTIEYYTKLSHFSVGADIDAIYVLGLDLALTPVGYMKYTF